jgi:hypothetical protein
LFIFLNKGIYNLLLDDNKKRQFSNSCRLSIEKIACERNASKEVLGKFNSCVVKIELALIEQTVFSRYNIFLQLGLFYKRIK